MGLGFVWIEFCGLLEDFGDNCWKMFKDVLDVVYYSFGGFGGDNLHFCPQIPGGWPNVSEIFIFGKSYPNFQGTFLLKMFPKFSGFPMSMHIFAVPRNTF